VLDETVRQARQLDPQREIQLHIDSDLKILRDKDALKQILLIALDNALKHSASNINVSAKQNGSLVEIACRISAKAFHPKAGTYF
jgi:signal transduction histidine kinase